MIIFVEENPMKDSQLLDIMKALSQKELKEFGDFVRSPFFNKNQSVVTLFTNLKKYHPDFPEDKIEKKRIYNHMFPGAIYSDGFMRKIMSLLSDLAEKYLVYKGYSENVLQTKDLLLEQYHLRGKIRLFKKTYKDFLRIEKKYNMLDLNMLYYGYNGRMKNLDFSAEHKAVEFLKFANKTSLIEPFEFLSAYFLSSVFNLYEYYLNTQRVADLKLDHRYFENIINVFDKKLLLKYPYLNIHFYVYKMLTEPENDKYFYDLKTYMFKNTSKLDKGQTENIYINMQNYCMRKIRRNQLSYAKDLLELYEQDLVLKKYSEENNLSYILYRNVIFTALLLGKYDYADNFAETYRNFLPENVRELYYLSAKANIALKKKDYSSAEKFLGKIKGIDELLKSEVKSMQLQVYFETDAHNQFYSLIDTFRHYLKNNKKISGERKNVYNSFINFSSKIFSLKENFDRLKLDKLKTEIQNYENVINKAWLLEKIAELGNKKSGKNRKQIIDF